MAVESVEMRCLVHVFGGTLLGLRVQSEYEGAVLFSRVSRPKRERAEMTRALELFRVECCAVLC